MDFTRLDFKIQTFEDLATRDLGLEVIDDEAHVGIKRGGRMAQHSGGPGKTRLGGDGGGWDFGGGFRRADGAGAVDGDIQARNFSARRQVPVLKGIHLGCRVHIDHLAAGLAVEMYVLVQVCAVAGLATLQVDLSDEAVRGKML